MNMTSVRLIVLSFCVTAIACMADSTENVWDGEYSYYASGGHTAGGSPIMVDITLKIGAQGGKESCELNADGYQTYDRILCTAVVKKKSVGAAV